MHGKHEFPFDYILLCSHAFGILYNCLPSLIVGIDKSAMYRQARSISTRSGLPFRSVPALGVLGRDKFKGHLLTEVRDNSGALQ